MRKPIIFLLAALTSVTLTACVSKPDENSSIITLETKKNPSGHTVRTYRTPHGYSIEVPVGWGGIGSYTLRFYDDPFCQGCELIGPLIPDPGPEDLYKFYFEFMGMNSQDDLEKSGSKSWKDYFVKKNVDFDETTKECMVRIISPQTSCFGIYDKNDVYQFSYWLREHEGDLYEFLFDDRNQIQVDALNSIRFDE